MDESHQSLRYRQQKCIMINNIIFPRIYQYQEKDSWFLRLIDSDNPHPDVSYILVSVFIKDAGQLQRLLLVDIKSRIQQNPKMLNIWNSCVFQSGFIYVFYSGITQNSLIGSS